MSCTRLCQRPYHAIAKPNTTRLSSPSREHPHPDCGRTRIASLLTHNGGAFRLGADIVGRRLLASVPYIVILTSSLLPGCVGRPSSFDRPPLIASKGFANTPTGPAHFGSATPAALARYHNNRVGQMKSLWADARMKVEWTDEQGQRHQDIGDGYLAIVMPTQVYLSYAKLNERLIVLGCDSDRFWVFDRTVDPPTAWLCRHSNRLRPETQPFNHLFHPLELLVLAGLTALPLGSV